MYQNENLHLCQITLTIRKNQQLIHVHIIFKAGSKNHST